LLTIAALKHLEAKGKKVVSVISGGNMDVITMASVVQHGLMARDRVFTVSVLLPDKPGQLVKVASLIAEQKANVISLEHNQFFSINRNDLVELRITLEAFGTEHKMQILQVLEEGGFRPRLVDRKGSTMSNW
ncbi:MAG: ACT domain-containing protein, partial [Lachnospiraceae bacterium]|nr:ACT domain-containing protein [Lachnospiraceae bacterium]